MSPAKKTTSEYEEQEAPEVAPTEVEEEAPAPEQNEAPEYEGENPDQGTEAPEVADVYAPRAPVATLEEAVYGKAAGEPEPESE